ncbi:MAG: cysteine synthase A [Bacteroidales bacterium]|nr:cysteine synthase A [Bacteroidales bacterium]
MKADSVLDLIGNTPVLRINRLFDPSLSVWIKLERANPGGSIKDRIALSMINDAERNGVLKPGSVIIEPTSGNTGIGLAMVAACRNYRVILVMPESMSVERRKIMSAYGAELELTPREKGMKGAIERAYQLKSEIPGSWIPMQFDNPANPEIHIKTTAEEILNDFPGGLDYMFACVGTGGHLTGCAGMLKQRFPRLRVFAVEPEQSPVLSGGTPGPHPIQGIGPGFVPSILDTQLIDEVIRISREEAYSFTRKAAREEGLFVGISTGAALAAVHQKSGSLQKGSTILLFNYDSGEKYLTTEELF